jgi:ABC-type lipoprotein release transport system permease subunit
LAVFSIRGLFQSRTRDPVTLDVVALLLLATGLGASVLPASRGTRVDPVKSLQPE